jgi:hypothetical protein
VLPSVWLHLCPFLSTCIRPSPCSFFVYPFAVWSSLCSCSPYF